MEADSFNISKNELSITLKTLLTSMEEGMDAPSNREAIPIALELIKEGVDVNTVSKHGFTLLHYAVIEEDVKAIDELLEFPGIDVNQSATEPLSDESEVNPRKYFDVSRVILTSTYTPLTLTLIPPLSSKKSNLSFNQMIYGKLRDNGARISRFPEDSAKREYTPRDELLELITTLGKYNEDTGEDPFSDELNKQIDYLLEKINKSDATFVFSIFLKHFKYQLINPDSKNIIATLKLFIKRGADVNCYAYDEGYAVLHLAALRREGSLINFLLRQKNLVVNIEYRSEGARCGLEGFTPLYIELAHGVSFMHFIDMFYNGGIPKKHYLYEKRSHPNDALIDKEIYALLRRKGAFISAEKNTHDISAAQCFLSNMLARLKEGKPEDQRAMVKFTLKLLEAGGNINDRFEDNRLLHHLILHGDLRDIYEYIQYKPDFNARGQFRMTAIECLTYRYNQDGHTISKEEYVQYKKLLEQAEMQASGKQVKRFSIKFSLAASLSIFQPKGRQNEISLEERKPLLSSSYTTYGPQ